MEEPPIEVIEIPDPLFLAYLVENFDLDGDGEISVEEAKNVLENNAVLARLAFSPSKRISELLFGRTLTRLELSSQSAV